MAIEFRLNGSASSNAHFITYAPSPAQLRQTGSAAPLQVTLSSRKATLTGGEAVFYPQAGAPSQATLALTLPADGSWVDLFVGGKWESPSTDRDDCTIDVRYANGVDSFSCMVRLRKNANTLSTRERDRFLAALGRMNASGLYQSFRNVHVLPADDQEHGGPYFLPWHRAYLLDFERELQAIDPEVTLPYWKFDEPAPNVFSADFMGQTKRLTSFNATPPKVTFTNGHPLAGWVVDTLAGVRRGAMFNPLTEPAKGPPPFPSQFPVLTEANTLALGHVFSSFRDMERMPHGAAHVSFVGPINSPPTAPRDPLFFMLHSNVDRLWALWQWLERHYLASDSNAYQEFPGQPKGWKLADTLWPWDGDQMPPRPPIPPPRNALQSSPTTTAPGPQPQLSTMIDVDGRGSPAARLGYGYDIVPFEES